jgi:hypothetical protein
LGERHEEGRALLRLAVAIGYDRPFAGAATA